MITNMFFSLQVYPMFTWCCGWIQRMLRRSPKTWIASPAQKFQTQKLPHGCTSLSPRTWSMGLAKASSPLARQVHLVSRGVNVRRTFRKTTATTLPLENTCSLCTGEDRQAKVATKLRSTQSTPSRSTHLTTNGLCHTTGKLIINFKIFPIFL